MLHWQAITASLLLGVAPADGLDRSALIKLIDAAREAAYRDVTFEYEGKSIIPGPIEQKSMRLGPDGLEQIFTGTFRYRADGATSIDVYITEKRRGKDRTWHGQVATLRGATESSTRYADEKQAKITVDRPRSIPDPYQGNYRAIWLSEKARALAETPYMYDFVGSEWLDGAECLVVRFRLVLDETTPKGDQVSETFWIDVSRGCHVIRHEHRWGNNLVGRTTVRLGDFLVKPGRTAWLPISGRVESHLAYRDKQDKFLNEPVHYQIYDIIPVTVRFDQDLRDSAFSIKAMPGDVVSDQARKARYEFGQYLARPKEVEKIASNAEIKKNLDKMLNDSAVMNKELKASSPLRNGPGWLSYWPWAVAAGALAGAGLIFVRRRRG